MLLFMNRKTSFNKVQYEMIPKTYLYLCQLTMSHYSHVYIPLHLVTVSMHC